MLLAIYLLKYSPWNVLEFNHFLCIASLPSSALWPSLEDVLFQAFFIIIIIFNKGYYTLSSRMHIHACAYTHTLLKNPILSSC